VSDFHFFWHDYETFGRTPRRDWPAQFAGVRTDAQLREVGEPVMLYCQPPRDRLPEPEACLLTGIVPQVCAERGLPEHAFAARIEQVLGEPGTVGCGYNTLRFDDEVTRFLFWRNLIDPYSREWRNGCGRWDLLDTMRCAWALRPEGLQWPLHDDGRVSFKLEDLARANGLLHESAHDALSDVRATISLARTLRQQQPRLFDYCLSMRTKDAVWQQIGGVGTQGRPLLHVSGRFDTRRGCIAMVWPLAVHPTNRNEVLVWDLARDPAELEDLDAAAIRQRLFTREDVLPEGTRRLPIKSIHVNRSPVVISQLRTLPDARAAHWGLDIAEGLRHAGHMPQVCEAVAARWPAVYRRPEGAAVPDVDEDLYGGFIGDEDRRLLERLRALPEHDMGARRPSFADSRLDELWWRYRARNFPQTLSDAERDRWLAHCSDRLHHGADGACTLAAFQDRIDTLSETADERGQAILEALLDWAQDIAP
jgi:exodeoxyribonuclease-1